MSQLNFFLSNTSSIKDECVIYFDLKLCKQKLYIRLFIWNQFSIVMIFSFLKNFLLPCCIFLRIFFYYYYVKFYWYVFFSTFILRFFHNKLLYSYYKYELSFKRYSSLLNVSAYWVLRPRLTQFERVCRKLIESE